jgi:hypothetical protein
MATVQLGFTDVLCVVGADHIEPVEQALRSATSPDLAVDLDETTASPVFLGRRALKRLEEERAFLTEKFNEKAVAAQRHVTKKPAILQLFEARTELDAAVNGGKTGELARQLQDDGAACRPTDFSELREWWLREASRL